MSKDKVKIKYGLIKTNNPPTPGIGFSLLSIPEFNSLLLFSGKTQSNTYNDTFLLNLDTNEWSTPEIHGDPPKNISHCASWYDPPNAFFHGGLSSQNKSTNETYFIDLQTLTWHKIFTMESPSTRYGHCAARNDDKQAYIFGGCNIGKSERFLGDLHKLEYKSMMILEGDDANNVNGASWITNIATKGVKPPGRKGHSLVYLPFNNSLILYGGECKTGINDKEIYMFSIDEKEWKKLDVEFELSPRAYHIMTLLCNNVIILYGGKTDKKVEDEVLYMKINDKIEIVRDDKRDTGVVNKRYGMCASEVIEENGTCHLMIMGGKDENDKFYELNPIDMIVSDGSKDTKKNSPRNENNGFVSPIPVISPTSSSKNTPGSSTPNVTKNKNGIPISSRLPNASALIQQKKDEYSTELSNLQEKFCELFQKNFDVTEEYENNVKDLETLKKRIFENELLILEKKSRSTSSKKELNALKEEIASLSQKTEMMKAMASEIKAYLGLSNERFFLISEFLSDYMIDIQTMDQILIKTQSQNMIYTGIDYEELSRSRKKYKRDLSNYLEFFSLYTKYESDKINQIERQENANMNSLSFRDKRDFKDSLEFSN